MACGVLGCRRLVPHLFGPTAGAEGVQAEPLELTEEMRVSETARATLAQMPTAKPTAVTPAAKPAPRQLHIRQVANGWVVTPMDGDGEAGDESVAIEPAALGTLAAAWAGAGR
jgi:hypothetical protein